MSTCGFGEDLDSETEDAEEYAESDESIEDSEDA